MSRVKFYPDFRKATPWPALKVGDVVDVVAPAWACSPNELRGAERFLRKWGLVPRVPRDIFAKVPLFAQTDDKRFAQLAKALLAPDSKAVWCVRGGYGAIRLLPRLARLKRPKVAKMFIGYSDITTLHSFLHCEWHWATVHGPLLDRFGRGANRPQETREMKGLIFGGSDAIEYQNLVALNKPAQRPSNLVASVVGGNLAVLQSSLGTPWQVNPNGHIVFFEDTGERPHRVDRMLTQMQQAGYFNKAKAVVFGPLLVGQRRDHRLLWQDVIPRFAESVKFPVLAGMPVGHGDRQRPLPLLTKAWLTMGARPRLQVLSGVKP